MHMKIRTMYNESPNGVRRFAIGFAVAMAIMAQAAVGLAEDAHHEDAEHHHEDHDHPNHFAIFVGSTQSEEHEGDRNDPQFTLGFDYERRLSRLFGLGFLADYVIEGHRELLVGIPGFFHVPNGPTFQLAPGWHKAKESGHSGGVVRLGLLWEFDVTSSISLTPAVFYDIAKEDNLWVFGLNVGKGW
jgi:hypothetical protein